MSKVKQSSLSLSYLSNISLILLGYLKPSSLAAFTPKVDNYSLLIKPLVEYISNNLLKTFKNFYESFPFSINEIYSIGFVFLRHTDITSLFFLIFAFFNVFPFSLSYTTTPLRTNFI